MHGIQQNRNRTLVERALGPLRRLWADETGLTALEYALLLMLMALSALVAWRSMGDVVATSVEGSSGQTQNASAMVCGGGGVVTRPIP